MSCKFSFEFKPNETSKQSRFKTNEEEYRVSISCRTNSDFDVNVQWEKNANVTVMAEIFKNATSDTVLQKRVVVKNSNKTVFIISTFYISNGVCLGFGETSYICVIHIIPLIAYENTSYWDLNKVTIDTATTKKIMTQVQKQPYTVKNLEKLSADLRNGLNNGELSDVTLKIGTTEIRAHKFMLSSRSSVFAKMFQTNMKEKMENCVSISDISSEVMKEFLSFIYTGTVTIKSLKTARDLYITSDKYGVKDLREECSVFLKDVNLDTVLDTLILSDLYNDKDLKLSALDFISQNYSQVKNHSSWENLLKGNQALAIEILGYVIEKKK